MKVKYERFVDIGRREPQAEILGFAQDDMVQSFVNGVDPQYRRYISSIIREAIEDTARLVLTPVINDKDKTKAILGGISDDFDKMSEHFAKKSDVYIDKKFTQDVKDMVRLMPRQDLATLAESLIEITSLKRKVTRDRETVGGEVDVAVISRSEGMVWVKRKHYFPSELNARYFARQFPKGR